MYHFLNLDDLAGMNSVTTYNYKWLCWKPKEFSMAAMFKQKIWCSTPASQLTNEKYSTQSVVSQAYHHKNGQYTIRNKEILVV